MSRGARARRIAVQVLRVLCGTFALPLAAQVGGTISSTRGLPIPDAHVEVRCGSELVDAVLSGPDGTFQLRKWLFLDRGECAAVVRRIGFRPAYRTIGADSIKIELEALDGTVMLPDVTVNAKRASLRPCDRTESKAAKAIYERAAAKYRDDTSLLDRFVLYGSSLRVVPESDREILREGVPLRNYHRRRGDRAQAADTLAFPVPQARYDRFLTQIGWLLPRFEWSESGAFVMPAFIQSMSMSVASTGPQRTVLSFCPRVRRVSYASGEIELGRDTNIVAVRWEFSLRPPRNEVGGIAYFRRISNVPGVRGHLLPKSTLVWTPIPGSRSYEVRQYDYGDWLVTARDSITLAQYGKYLSTIGAIDIARRD